MSTEMVSENIKTEQEEQSYVVNNFEYNGFYGNTLKGNTDYTARFKEWTNDPGVAVFKCSDGKERLIPTFAIVGQKPDSLPEQDMSDGVLFGPSCKS